MSPQDFRDRWWWVEPSVWTDRMLTQLEQSEPTTEWFRLWDKVLAERNLQAAFWAVWRNDGAPGVDGQTVQQFDEQASAELAGLREELHTRRYRRQPARRVWIPKPGTTERRRDQRSHESMKIPANPTLCLTEEWGIRRMPPCCDRFDPGTGSQADRLPTMGGAAWLWRMTLALNND